MSSDAHVKVRWPALLFLFCVLVAVAHGCNLFTGVGDLQFPCDMFRGTGCGSGQTCRFSPEEMGPACFPLSAGAVAAYAACAQDSECPGGHLCVAGLCRKYCGKPSDCGWDDARCIPAKGEAFSTCTRSCDLITPEDPRIGSQACGAGARCDVVADAGEEYTDCLPATGTGLEDAVCQANVDCQAGLYCQRKRCKRGCDSSVSTCGGGQSCAGYSTIARQSVGSCCTLTPGRICDLVTDCGCGSGETCVIADPAAGTTTCRRLVATPLPPYSACTNSGECPSGHSCIGRSLPLQDFRGVCALNCNTVDDCGSDGSLCQPAGNSFIQGSSFCVRGCDPLSPEVPDEGFASCGPGATCSINFFASGYSTDCRPVFEGAVAPYEACETNVECPKFHSCVDGNCKQNCAVGADCPWPDAVCEELAGPSDGRTFKLCSRSCDALAPTSSATGFQPCGAGLGCTMFTNGDTPSFDCYRPGAAPEGGSCNFNRDCESGLFCLNARTCVPYCELGSTTCAIGTVCTQLNPPLPVVAGRPLGICLPDVAP